MLELDANLKRPTHRGRSAQNLTIRLKTLARDLCLETPPQTQAAVDRILAYRLLAHSEIQAFLDGLNTKVLEVSGDRYASAGVITHAAHHLVVFNQIERLVDKRRASDAQYPRYSTSSLSSIPAAEVRSALQRHRERTEKNGGVKASNINTRFGPLGFRTAWHLTGFLDQMNAFGVSRGNAAHLSGVLGTTQWPTGSVEVATIHSLLPGLVNIERYVSTLLRPS